MDNDKILVGSRYFFSVYDDFHSKDSDYVKIIEKSNEFKYNREIHLAEKCIFEIVKYPAKDIIIRIIENGSPMQIGKFLVPEFAEKIGFTFNDINLLLPAIEKLDDKHQYEKIIFNSYIENGKFELTEEQRKMAYNEYKKERGLN